VPWPVPAWAAASKRLTGSSPVGAGTVAGALAAVEGTAAAWEAPDAAGVRGSSCGMFSGIPYQDSVHEQQLYTNSSCFTFKRYSIARSGL
jgi:hypothetical protein